MKPLEQAQPQAVSEYPARRWDGRALTPVRETIAEEVPVGLIYNGTPYVVMLATPKDLEEFAVGFSLSEGIVNQAAEISSVQIAAHEIGVEIHIALAHTEGLEGRTRNLAGRTGCGLCGTQSIEQVFRPLSRVREGVPIDPQAVEMAFQELRAQQPLHNLTGAVHAAAWADARGKIVLAREDVGRHNALDKMIGAAVRRGLSFDAGFAVFTSRASSEMVQKSAAVGIPLVAAVSAPTGLAVRLAEESGLTLIGFARDRHHTIYANAHRIGPATRPPRP